MRMIGMGVWRVVVMMVIVVMAVPMIVVVMMVMRVVGLKPADACAERAAQLTILDI